MVRQCTARQTFVLTHARLNHDLGDPPNETQNLMIELWTEEAGEVSR